MKDNTNYIMDDLLVKYLLGEATETEKQEVQEWISADAEHRRYFDHFRTIWEAGARLAVNSNADENAAWERFRQRTQNQPANEQRKTIPFRLISKTWLRAAAMLVFLAGGGWLAYYMISNPALLEVHSGADILAVTLPDESVVTLNKHTTLSYPKRFAGNTRQIQLTGEAFFEVTADKDKPFVIRANDATIRVVGTSFNIKSSMDTTEVIVATGIVEVSKKENGILLHPNEKAIVRKDRTAPEKRINTDELYNYYHTREFVCNGTPLWRVTDVLGEAYDVDIIVADRLKHLPLTATFRDEPLDHILHVIGETFQVQVQRNGQQVIIK